MTLEQACPTVAFLGAADVRTVVPDATIANDGAVERRPHRDVVTRNPVVAAADRIRELLAAGFPPYDVRRLIAWIIFREKRHTTVAGKMEKVESLEGLVEELVDLAVEPERIRVKQVEILAVIEARVRTVWVLDAHADRVPPALAERPSQIEEMVVAVVQEDDASRRVVTRRAVATPTR